MKFDRRKAMGMTGALVAAAAASSSLATTPRPDAKRATYVLIHGGGHGGWCWKRVAEPLAAQGHRVYAPSLTGLADRSHLLSPGIDLDTHITDVVNLLDWEDLSDVILVGHSYGGMVITGTADRAPGRIGQLVYLDAAHPKNGDPLFVMPSAPGQQSLKGGGAGGSGSAAGAPKLVDGVELVMFPDEKLITGALGVTKPEDVAWLMDKLTPHPVKCFTQPLRLQNEAALGRIPRTDIWRSMVLRQLDPDGSRRKTMATRVWEIDSTSHDLMITEPAQVTEMLLRLAAESNA